MSSLLTEEQARMLEEALEAKRQAALKAAARARARGELAPAPSLDEEGARGSGGGVAATAAAAASHGAAGSRPHRPPSNRGAPKKGGGGGKWTWGRLLAAAGAGAGANAGGGAAAAAAAGRRRSGGAGAAAGAARASGEYVRALDRRDPNYDSAEEDEEATVAASRSARRRRSGQGANGSGNNGNGGSNAPSSSSPEELAARRIAEGVAHFKAEVGRIVREFFDAGDVADVARSLEELVYEAEDLEEQRAALLAAAEEEPGPGAAAAEEQEEDEGGAQLVAPPSSAAAAAAAPFVGPSPAALHYFVKALLREAMDRRDREREAASVLLSALLLMGGGGGGGAGGACSAAVLPADQVEKGFATALDQLEDTILDVPDAPEMLATFLARAVVDDVLPPAAVARLCGGGGGGGAAGSSSSSSSSPRAAVKQRAELLLSARHAGERLLRCWGADPAEAGAAAAAAGNGGGGARGAAGASAAASADADADADAAPASGGGGGGPFLLASAEAIKGRMAAILAEHEASGDAAEAARCLRALGVPFFHHELAKQAARAAMAAAAARDAAAASSSSSSAAEGRRLRHLRLLRALAATGELSPYQLLRGLRRVAESLEDAALDEPRAREHFSRDVLDALERPDEKGGEGGAALLLTPTPPLEPEDWAELRVAAAPGAAAAAAAEAAAAASEAVSAEAAAATAAVPPFAAAGPGGSRVQAFKADVTAALREYFESADLGECAARLREAAGGPAVAAAVAGAAAGAGATAAANGNGSNCSGAATATVTAAAPARPPPPARGVAHPGLLPLAVKRAVELALDRRDREKELCSRLLAALGPLGLTSAPFPRPSELESGFARLLAGADDLVLDCPDAVRLLALFLGRACVDEALPPAALQRLLPSLPDGGLGVAVVSAAGAMLSARHGAERLSECWHGASRGWGGGGDDDDEAQEGEEGQGAAAAGGKQGGGGGGEGGGGLGRMPLSAVRRALRAAVDEYYGSARSADEVERCLRDLAVPHYHHELVKQLLVACFSRLHCTGGGGSGGGGKDGSAEAAAAAAEAAARADPAVVAAGDVLAALAASGAVSSTQLALGLGRVRERLADEALDSPGAPAAMAALLGRARDEGWLPAEMMVVQGGGAEAPGA